MYNSEAESEQIMSILQSGGSRIAPYSEPS